MPRALLCPGDLALSSRSAAGALLPFQEIWLFHRLRAKQPSRIHQQLYHRAKRCGQEVTATPRTATLLPAQGHCSSLVPAGLSAQFCGKPLLRSSGKCCPPWEASILTPGQDQQACSSLGAAGKPAASQLAPFATSCLLHRSFSRMGAAKGRA